MKDELFCLRDIFNKQPRRTIVSKLRKFDTLRWVWDCAYADAIDTPSMLTGQIYDELTVGTEIKPLGLHMSYCTKRGAKEALVRAIKRFISKQSKAYLK